MELRDELRFINQGGSILRTFVTEIHARSNGITTYCLQCMRCGQEMSGALYGLRGLRTISRSILEFNIDRMDATAFRDIMASHNARCWDYREQAFTTNYTDYTSSTVYFGEMPGVHEDREPIRIRTNEYGEQYIDRPITTREQARELANRASDLVGEIIKPFTKEERRRKQRDKLIELNVRLIRDE